MSRTDNEFRITPSVLDRLIDREPDVSREPLASRASSLRQLKQSVRRDLEWLLNTRRHPGELQPGLKELNASLIAYGLSDFANASIKSPTDQGRLRRAVEAAIRTFEPRLEEVAVTLEPQEGIDRVLRFRIDGRLRVEPAPEPVTFDTVLQLAKGEYIVRGE